MTYDVITLSVPHADGSDASAINERGVVTGWGFSSPGEGVVWEEGLPPHAVTDPHWIVLYGINDFIFRSSDVVGLRGWNNTATNILIDRLGMAKIAARMQGLGLSGTKLRRHMMDTAAAKRGDENVSTPDEIVRLLQAMHEGMPDAIALLKKPKENRLRKGLPEGVESADKSGELEGVRVDAGIVFAKNRPYVLCVMTTFLKDEAEGERAIEAISRATYEYFSRLGAGGTLGRQVPR